MTLFKVVVGVLHLGNIEFKGDEVAEIVNPETLGRRSANFRNVLQINFGIDNQATIDLIAKPPKGILSCLNEECIMPNGTDESFTHKLVMHRRS